MVTRLTVDVGKSAFDSFKRWRNDAERLEKLLSRQEDYHEDTEGLGYLAYYRTMQGKYIRS